VFGVIQIPLASFWLSFRFFLFPLLGDFKKTDGGDMVVVVGWLLPRFVFFCSESRNHILLVDELE
jgi:hypothetical protein